MLDLRTGAPSIVGRWRAVVDGRTRAYQAALFDGAAGAPFRVTVGRQFSPDWPRSRSSTVGSRSWPAVAGTRAFAGSEPEPTDLLGYSTDVPDYGGYVQLHNRADETAAGRRRRQQSVPTRRGTNREFAYLQARDAHRRLSLYGTQEVDYYRAWKQAMGEPAGR